MVLEVADLPRLDLAQAEVEQDGLLHPRMDDPLGIGFLGQAQLTSIETVNDFLDGELCLGPLELRRIFECRADQGGEVGGSEAHSVILSQVAMACSICSRLGTSARRK